MSVVYPSTDCCYRRRLNRPSYAKLETYLDGHIENIYERNATLNPLINTSAQRSLMPFMKGLSLIRERKRK